jgi:hypothetical protein
MVPRRILTPPLARIREEETATAMLKVRHSQLKAFQPSAEAAFEHRVADYLRENHADGAVKLPADSGEVKEVEVKSLDDETLLKMIRTGIARARSYGMTWESSLTAFVVIMFVIAPNFDEHPLMTHILKDGSIEPDERIDRLWEHTTDSNWEAAKRDYNVAAWSDKG